MYVLKTRCQVSLTYGKNSKLKSKSINDLNNEDTYLMKKNDLVYFADLTHQGPVLSSNVFPLSIGLVAAWQRMCRTLMYVCSNFQIN